MLYLISYGTVVRWLTKAWWIIVDIQDNDVNQGRRTQRRHSTVCRNHQEEILRLVLVVKAFLRHDDTRLGVDLEVVDVRTAHVVGCKAVVYDAVGASVAVIGTDSEHGGANRADLQNCAGVVLAVEHWRIVIVILVRKK